MSRFECPICGEADWGFTGKGTTEYAGHLRDRGRLRGITGGMSGVGPYTTTSATCRACGYRAREGDPVLLAIHHESAKW